MSFMITEETDKETLDELLLELSNSLESVKRQKSKDDIIKGN